nr:hypothetical protein [uncultured Pseudomonas sp.]
MAVLRSHTRHAGLLASLIALPLLVMPQPTHTAERLMTQAPANMFTSASPGTVSIKARPV